MHRVKSLNTQPGLSIKTKPNFLQSDICVAGSDWSWGQSSAADPELFTDRRRAQIWLLIE